MADAERSRNTFTFFDLSLEMREAIYDESFDDDEEGILPCGLSYKASCRPSLSLLLVSKQVKQEYEDRAYKKTTLVITDNQCWTSARQMPFAMPSPAIKCQAVYANLGVACAEDLHQHLWRLANFVAKAASLKAVSIRLNVDYHPEGDEGLGRSDVQDVLNEKTLTMEQVLKELKVYDVHLSQSKVWWDFEDAGYVSLKWSEETGKVAEVN